jgi:hypothetical protein
MGFLEVYVYTDDALPDYAMFSSIWQMHNI